MRGSMASHTVRTLMWAGLLTAATACGGNTISTPEDLPLDTFAADEPFTMTFTMQNCSDGCATYEEGECDVSVDEEDRVIEADPSISFERDVADDECDNRCGPAVFAHCDVPALGPGTYEVRANGFETTITVE